jgi:hypothetical protein
MFDSSTLLAMAAIVLVGMALALSQFCMVRSVLSIRTGDLSPARCVLAISLAIALSLQLLAVVDGGETRPSYTPSIAVVLGGLVFGIAARANGGCFIGTLNELCRGHWRRLYIVAGWILGFALLKLPPYRLMSRGLVRLSWWCWLWLACVAAQPSGHASATGVPPQSGPAWPARRPSLGGDAYHWGADGVTAPQRLALGPLSPRHLSGQGSPWRGSSCFRRLRPATAIGHCDRASLARVGSTEEGGEGRSTALAVGNPYGPRYGLGNGGQ